MNPDLLEQLRALLREAGTPADATVAPRGGPPRQVIPVMRERMAGAPQSPAAQRGVFGAILRSAEPSPDTPMGWANEMFNPIRQGAAAREMAGRAVDAAQQGQLGKMAGMAALTAMAVPGIPGEDASLISRTMRQLEAAPEARPYFNVPDELMGFGRAPKGFSESKYPFTANVLVRWPDMDPMVDQIRGMNLEHALERARRNWEGADIKPYYGPLSSNPSEWIP